MDELDSLRIGTVIVTCDHCDNGHGQPGGISHRRSRRVMVRQLRAAAALVDAVEAVGARPLQMDLAENGQGPGFAPTITLGLDRFLTLWEAYRAYRALAPTGDDLYMPPTSPPPGTTLPTDAPEPIADAPGELPA